MTASIAAVGAAALLFLGGREARRWWAGSLVVARLGGPSRRRRPAPRPIVRLLEQAGVDGDPRAHLDMWLTALLLLAVAVPVTSGALVALAVVGLGPSIALVATRGRGDRRRAAQIPEALDIIAGSLRGGAALPRAIGDAATLPGRLGAEMATVSRHVRDGIPVARAIDDWARAHDADTSLAGAALTMAATVGGPGADAIEAAAASLRQRAAAANEVAALSVQARLSALVLSAAPIGFTFLLVSLDPSSARFLLATPAGWACIAAGVTLDGVGAWWMQRLVRRAT